MQGQSWTDELSLDRLRSYCDCIPVWLFTAVGLLGFAVFCLLAAAVDERMFNGVSVWAKPFKFSLSLAIYFATLLIFSRYLPVGYFLTRGGYLMAVSLALVAVVETAYIAVQGSLGEASHFNVTTPFHALMYSLMGIGATWLVTGPVWFAWVIGRANAKNDPMVLAIIVGLVLTFVLGGGSGSYLGGHAGHWVGAAETDANGIWLFNWATDGGDLRVAHFFGMHAMQAIPLFALLLPSNLSKRLACTLVIVFAAAYSALSAHTFIQAVRGQPFIA